MKLEVAAICDAATDQDGKLNMLGIFDFIEAELPVVLPRSAIVFRIRYGRSEAIAHDILVSLRNLDTDDGTIPIAHGSASFRPFSDDMDSAAINLIFNVNRLRFDKGGRYRIHLRIDEVLLETTVPFFVRDLTPQEPNPLAS